MTRNLTLRQKTLLIVSITVLGLLIFLYLISRFILLDSFTELERQDTQQNVERVLNAISNDVDVLDTKTSDWSIWDDTLAFVQGNDDEYIDSNLGDIALISLDVNFMLFSNLANELVYATGADPVAQTGLPVPESLLSQAVGDSLLLDHTEVDASIAGVMLLPEGPIMIASRPIVNSEGEGPIGGTVIWGRYFDESIINALSESTKLSLTSHLLDDPQLPADFQTALSRISANTPIFIQPIEQDTIAGYTVVNDIQGQPALLIRIDMPRKIYRQGQTSLNILLVSLLFAGVVFGAVSLFVMERQVLSRLTQLSTRISRIQDISSRVSVGGQDELSGLAEEINRTLSLLQHSEETNQQAREIRSQKIYQTGTNQNQLTNFTELAERYSIDIRASKHRYVRINQMLNELGDIKDQSGISLSLNEKGQLVEVIGDRLVASARDSEKGQYKALVTYMHSRLQSNGEAEPMS